MKNVLLFYLLVILIILPACNSLKLSPEEKARKTLFIHQSIEKDHYTIEVNQARPLRGKPINLSSSYDLTIRNDSAIAYLPFFGYATQTPFTETEGGIRFAQKTENYIKTALSNEKGWSIKFEVNTREYNYKFNITVFDNGNTTMDVISIQRDPIFFYGEIKLPDIK